MKSLLFLSFLLAFSFVNCDWTPAKEITGQGLTIKHYSTYMDRISLKTYIAYCAESTTPDGQTTQILKFATINNWNQLESDILIPITSGCRVAKIAGDGNQGGLIIAIEGQRIFHLGVCNETNPKGCYDIYVLYSQDYGVTWSDPSPVARQHLGDIADRLSPSLVINPSNKRAYLFYTYRQMASAETQIALVTRPPGSDVFMTEINTKITAEDRLISALTTVKSGRVVIHLFYEAKGNNMHVWSENGIVWNQNLILSGEYKFTSFVADFGALAAQIFGIFTDGSHTYITVSNDHGITWDQMKVINEPYHRVSAGVLCRATEESKLKLNILTTSFMQTDQEFLAVNIPEGNVENKAAPFKEVQNYGVFLPQLWCYTSDTTHKPAIKVFSYIWAKPNSPRIYLSENESI